MKSLSVSFLGILTILFAVTSASTATSFNKKRLDDPVYGVYGIPDGYTDSTGHPIFNQGNFIDDGTASGHAVHYTDSELQSMCENYPNPPMCIVIIKTEFVNGHYVYTIIATWFGSYIPSFGYYSP
jgi:hypothetical protein